MTTTDEKIIFNMANKSLKIVKTWNPAFEYGSIPLYHKDPDIKSLTAIIKAGVVAQVNIEYHHDIRQSIRPREE
jgi:hypothetical protein